MAYIYNTSGIKKKDMKPGRKLIPLDIDNGMLKIDNKPNPKRFIELAKKYSPQFFDRVTGVLLPIKKK